MQSKPQHMALMSAIVESESATVKDYKRLSQKLSDIVRKRKRFQCLAMLLQQTADRWFCEIFMSRHASAGLVVVLATMTKIKKTRRGDTINSSGNINP